MHTQFLQSQSENSGQRMSYKILVVDDEPDILELVETRLSMAGYSTVTADSGEEALKAFFIERPDLALFDVRQCGICQVSSACLIKIVWVQVGRSTSMISDQGVF